MTRTPNIFEIVEEGIELRKEASLAHLIGSREETISFLPDLSSSIEKDARRNFSQSEKHAIIDEMGEASNIDRLDIKGTHYETQSAADIAMLMPMKGLL